MFWKFLAMNIFNSYFRFLIVNNSCLQFLAYFISRITASHLVFILRFRPPSPLTLPFVSFRSFFFFILRVNILLHSLLSEMLSTWSTQYIFCCLYWPQYFRFFSVFEDWTVYIFPTFSLLKEVQKIPCLVLT